MITCRKWQGSEVLETIEGQERWGFNKEYERTLYKFIENER